MKSELFVGSGTLTRFIFRRDRVILPIWLVSIAGFIILLVPVFENIMTTGTDNRVMAEMMLNPAMIAMVGPVYGADNYTTGAAYGNMMLVFSVMIVGVMNIFLISRHTRQDEELGRLEVIRSLPVGSLSNLTSAMVVSLIVNLILSLISGFGLYALREGGMTFLGCMIFGISLGVIGLFFAAATALFCQFTANNRTATGLSFLLLFLLYMLRAIGDVGNEILSLISPLGLILRTEAFVNNYWWPIIVVLIISIALTALAFTLAKIRDLGRGLLSERPGKRHANHLLSSPFGLAIRLLRTSILVWAITVFVFAAMYGSIFGELERFIESNEMLQAIFSSDIGFSLTEQFVALLITIMTMIGTIPVLSAINRVYGEEKHGFAEHILGKAVFRTSQLTAYFIPAIAISIILQVLSALGFWSVGSIVLETAPSLEVFMKASLAYLPAMWVMLGISMLLVAFYPSKSFLSYIYLGYSFISIYLGTIAGFPEWMKKLTPFGHIPQYPIEELKAFPLMVLTFLAVLLFAISYFGYRKRDLQTQQ